MVSPHEDEMSVCESIRYLEIGRGNVPVVLLHGLFGSPENWRVIMEDLADDYRLLALQFPIDHQSNRRHTDFRGIEQLTDYVEAFLDQVGLEDVVLCGNSLGGQVAVDLCLRDPGRIRRLVITGSAGLFERSLSGGERPRVSRQLVRDRAEDIFHDRKHVTDELVEEVYQMLTDRKYVRFLIRIAKATRDRNMSEELWQVKLPTLIIWGKDDTITPPFVAEQFREGLPNARLVYIDDCGHAPPIEQPLQFSRILRKFLTSPIPACRSLG